MQSVRGRHPADVNTQHVYSVCGARALRLCHVCEDIAGTGGGKQCTHLCVKRPLTLPQIIYGVKLHMLVLNSVKGCFVKAYHAPIIALFASVVSSSTSKNRANRETILRHDRERMNDRT